MKKDLFKDVKLTKEAINSVISEEKIAFEKAEERLKKLERLSNCKVPESFRDGFLQGFYEGMFPIK